MGKVFESLYHSIYEYGLQEKEKMMDKLRIGIVGFGNMGSSHVRHLMEGHVDRCELVAVCDINETRLDKIQKEYDEKLTYYTEYIEFLDHDMDAVLIATPHYDHPVMGMAAIDKGLHILVEKPIGVYTKAVEELNQKAQASGKVFGIMYNQRTNPIYQKARDLVQSGELGELVRVNWTITNWFRSQRYYDSGGWRATWEGEGGGVLLNQCPHQLDMIQWICGMPKRIRGFCDYGKFHNIEVEDDVTAFFEYENGATGLFITSTGEAPGTNRLEISGDMGKLVIEDNTMTFYRNRVATRQHSDTTPEGFKPPENWTCQIPVEGSATEHVGIMQNFTDAILDGTDLLAPGNEGIYGLTISNAIHLSDWMDDWVELPIDGNLYYDRLQEKIQESTYTKKVKEVVFDLKGSH
jgi:predicted dehydrogenase